MALVLIGAVDAQLEPHDAGSNLTVIFRHSVLGMLRRMPTEVAYLKT